MKVGSKAKKIKRQAKKDHRTRKHSSRKGTARSLPYSGGGLCSGGLCPGGGVSEGNFIPGEGGLCLWGVSVQEGSPWQRLPPPVNRITDRCKKHYFAATSLRAVINDRHQRKCSLLVLLSFGVNWPYHTLLPTEHSGVHQSSFNPVWCHHSGFCHV